LARKASGKRPYAWLASSSQPQRLGAPEVALHARTHACEMGQGFLIASPSVNEVLHWGGKLGENLFDGSAKSIVRLLAVPVRPSKSA
jgi:hypothetical protein